MGLKMQLLKTLVNARTRRRNPAKWKLNLPNKTTNTVIE
ncbi:MAG: hypothetical protein JWP81_43 [Ferruginibacter sp.]|nr:hypothetical protein [Ferruginibacter sp.]